jgi:threonine synthase
VNFLSTRNKAPSVSADQAIRAGVAPDGGLYLPETFPDFSTEKFDDLRSVAEIGEMLLRPFFQSSPLGENLGPICRSAFNFKTPLIQPDKSQPELSILELFHGPTGAFKDFGARFLFRCLDHIATSADPVTVLAATSGDTGGAVGCAAEGGSNARAVILYPKGRISAFQERQLCCWRSPVKALRVDGDFDDCQRLVKAAFANSATSKTHGLTSANSISIGRLLPQMTYWAYASLSHYRETQQRPGLIIPTGNLGNAVAAVLARTCGLPIGPIVLATNANRTLSHWRESGDYVARAAIATIANAMDVGDPSNFERLNALSGARIESIHRVDDSAIRARIVDTFNELNYVACPHTATALEAYSCLDDRTRKNRPWIIAATAHPYKFADVVDPLTGSETRLPDMLASVMTRDVSVTDIAATDHALAVALD